MKNRGTYALLALFFAGLVGLWAADFAQVPTRNRRDRGKGRVLVDLIDAKPDDVRKIEIEGGAGPLVFERREGNRWQMTSPRDVAADPLKVENLAFNLKELARKPEADTLRGDAASFGLAPPSRTVRVWGVATDAPLATLEVGKLSLDRRYVRAGGSEGVEVVEARMVELVDLPAERWRDRELFRVPSFEVDAVRVTGAGADLELRRGPDAWRIVAPFRALAAEPRVEGLIADLGSLRVKADSQFIAEGVTDEADLDRYGLKSPRLTIEVKAGRGERRRPTQVLHVGKAVEGKPGQAYARRGGQDDVVAVDSRVLDRLGSDANSFRSPRVVDVRPARVVRFRVKSEGKEFDLVRSGPDWYIVRPAAARADRKSVEEFLKAVGEFQTTMYLAPASAPESGLGESALVLMLWEAPDPRSGPSPGPGDEPSATVRFGRRDAAKRSIFARVEGDPTVLALPDTVGDALPRSALAFRDRSVLSVATGQIRRVVFEGRGRKVALRPPVLKLDPRKNSSEGWWMVEPVASPADSDSVGRLLKLLGDLKAEGFAAEPAADLAPFGLKEPLLTVTWTLPAQTGLSPSAPAGGPASPADSPRPEEQSLLIGSTVANRTGSRYAMIAGRPLVFVLGGANLALLDAEWHQHRVLSFDPGLARKLRLTWPGREFALSATADPAGRDWLVDGAVDAPGFVPSRSSALLKAASSLATARFVQYDGDFPAATGLAVPRFSLRVDLGDAVPPKLLRVGNHAGGGLTYATTAVGPRGEVFTLPESLFADWIKEPRRRGELPDDVFAPDRP